MTLTEVHAPQRSMLLSILQSMLLKKVRTPKHAPKYEKYAPKYMKHAPKFLEHVLHMLHPILLALLYVLHMLFTYSANFTYNSYAMIE